MVKKFLSLEWKQFVRSAAFQQKLLIKILMGLAALYFIACFTMLGVFAYFGIKESIPQSDPFYIVNKALIFWFFADLLIRFFLQKLPVVNIKPLMVLPVKRKIAINFLLGKGLVSFFNLLPMFFFVPFTIVILIKGYSASGVLLWFVSMLCITCAINLINFLINNNNWYFGIIAGVLGLFGFAWYYDIYDVTPFIGGTLYSIYTQFYFALIPVGLVVLFYYLNFIFLRKNFYLDGAIQNKIKEVESTDLSFLNRFGKIAPFLKNDIKMIWRNKRPRSILFVSFLFVFYGLFFFTNGVYEKMDWVKPFAGMFITGGFLMTFGQNVPSWDSEYYKLMMSQNIRYRTYLESKWYLMVFGTGIATILSIPYIYFGIDILLVIMGAALFNIGLNSFVVLWSGIFNKTAIKLNDKAKGFSNKQAFNATMLLISFPKLVLPIILFYIPYKLSGNWYVGVGFLGASGLIGLLLKSQILKAIEKLYQKEKYKTIAAYSKKD